MMFRRSTMPFLPKGIDLLYASILLVIIALSGYATYSRMMNQIDAEIGQQAGFSTCTFDKTTCSIPENQIYHGGPPKDGIPSLTSPEMISSASADYLNPYDRVIGIALEGKVRAYPLRILTWHECVNDQAGDQHYAVTYCPLCDSTAVFDREVDNEVLVFGISGLLYQSNVLLYDRQANPKEESLWSQMLGEAIAGPKTGKRMRSLPHQTVQWQTWQIEHPDTEVLSLGTGHRRAYETETFGEYLRSPKLLFPVNAFNPIFSLKEKVIGVSYQNESKAYPIERINLHDAPLVDYVGGKKVILRRSKTNEAVVEAEPGVTVYNTYWFAWYTFNRDTEIYSGPGFNLEEWAESHLPNAQAESSG